VGNWLNLGKHPQYPGQQPGQAPPSQTGPFPGPGPVQGPGSDRPNVNPGAWTAGTPQPPYTGGASYQNQPFQNRPFQNQPFQNQPFQNQPYQNQPWQTPPTAGPVDPNAPPPPIPPDPSAYWHPGFWQRGAPVGAVVLIALGVLFLLGQLDIFHGRLIEFTWPVFLIGLGVWLVVRRLGESQGGPK
jgi:hypothetical protein